MTRSKQLALTFFEQAVMSLGTILVLFAAAQGLDPAQVGTFALAALTVLLLQSCSRALTGEVLLVLSAGAAAEHGSNEYRGAVSVLALTSAPLTFLIMLPLTGSLSLAIATAALAALSILQDGFRLFCIRNSRIRILLTVSLVANVAQVLLVWATSRATESLDLTVLALAAPLLLFLHQPRLSWILGQDVRAMKWFEWFHRYGSAGLAYTTEVLSGAVVGYAIALLLNFMVAPDAVAAFRATMSIFGATSVLINFARAPVLRAIREQLDENGRAKSGRIYLGLGGFFAVGVGSLYLLFSFIPLNVGSALLGAVWPLLVPLLALGAVDRFLASLSIAPTIILRAHGVTWSATHLRIGCAVLGLAVTPVLILLYGVAGAFLGEILVYVLLIVSLSLVMSRAIKSFEPEKS